MFENQNDAYQNSAACDVRDSSTSFVLTPVVIKDVKWAHWDWAQMHVPTGPGPSVQMNGPNGDSRQPFGIELPNVSGSLRAKKVFPLNSECLRGPDDVSIPSSIAEWIGAPK